MSLNEKYINKLYKLNYKFEILPKDSEKYMDSYFSIMNTIVLILSNKQIFKRNKDAAEFIEKLLNIRLKAYVKSNRNLLIGKTINYI